MIQTNLKRFREIKGISQAQLARAIGVGVSTVGMWENGKNKPDSKNLEKLAEFFSVSVSDLYADDVRANASLDDPRFDNMDTKEILENLATRDEMRVLFSLTKDATRDDILKTIKIIEALKNE